MARVCISPRGTFSSSMVFTVINKYAKGGAVQISTVFGTPYICFRRGPLRVDFLEVLFNHVFRCPEFWNTSAVRVIFFWKCSKSKLAFKNAATDCENIFYFCNNCIRIGSLKLSLLKREYLESAVNVFINIPKSLHITKRYLFQLNCLHSDQ